MPFLVIGPAWILVVQTPAQGAGPKWSLTAWNAERHIIDIPLMSLGMLMALGAGSWSVAYRCVSVSILTARRRSNGTTGAGQSVAFIIRATFSRLSGAGRFPFELSALAVIYGISTIEVAKWRGVTFGPAGIAEILRVSEELKTEAILLDFEQEAA